MIDPQHEPGGATSSVPATSVRPAASIPPVLPADQVFLETGISEETSFDVLPPRIPRRKWGPGFWESLAWMVGIHIVQFGTLLVAVVLLAVAFVMAAADDNSPGGDFAVLLRSLSPFYGTHLIVLLATAELATVAYALLAIRLRLGPHGLRDLGFHRPWKGHSLLIALLMPPLVVLCSALQAAIFRWFPGTRVQMEDLMTTLAQAPLSVLVLMVGLGPALAEEVLFRGLIGRGLLARYGLFAGMLMTSVLFGVVHVLPAQALVAIPIGLAMHFAYYTTRSFWAPMAVHFINNSLSVVLLKNGSVPTVAKFDQLFESAGGPPLYILVASAAMVTAILILLWETRVQWVLKDGSVWNPGFVTTSAPPAELEAIPVRQEPRLLILAGSTFNSLGFAAGVWRLTDWAGLPW
jgi:membrane protease YdiL (CAAX protease family)